MSYDKDNKLLFIDKTDPDNPKGITLMEISRCLQDYRRDKNGNIDLGMMCTSPNIKIWAKNKPVRHPSFQPLTDLQREEVDYGLDVSGAHDSNWEFLLTKAIESECKFQYLRPRGGMSEPYRQLDFDGYNHRAQPPYTIRWNHSKGNADGWMEAYESEYVDLRLSDLTPTLLPSDDMLSCHLVILYRKEGQSNVQGVIFPKIEGDYITLYDIENSESAPVARFTLPSEGTYHMVAAITDATEDELEDMFWMYLPEGYYSTIYDPNYTGFVWEYAEDNATVGRAENGSVVTTTDVDVYSLYFVFSFDAREVPDAYGNLIVEIGEWDGSELNDNQTYTYDGVMIGGEINSIHDTINSINSLFGNPTIDNIYIRARLEYKIVPAQTEYDVIYFDFLSGTQASTLQDPVSLLDIMESMGW